MQWCRIAPVVDIFFQVCFFLGGGLVVLTGLLCRSFADGARGRSVVRMLIPLVIFAFLAGFGGAGLLLAARMPDRPAGMQVAAGVAGGLVTAGLIFLVVRRVHRITLSAAERK
ncbi:MAG: hypothetical protein ACYTAF_00065 [Planctomycetota bacterium]